MLNKRKLFQSRRPMQFENFLANWSHARLMLFIFLTCLLVYLIFWSGHHYSIDGMVMFQYAKALLFRSSFRMDPPVLWGSEVIEVSKWAIGLTLVYMGVLGGLSSVPPLKHIDFSSIPYDPGTPYNELLLYDHAYRYSSFVNPLITALTAIFLYWLCILLGMAKKKAAAAALIFGIASPAAIYAKLDFAQPLASLFILLALIFFVRARSHGIKNLVAAGICLGFSILARTEMVIVPVSLFVIAAYFLQSNIPEERRTTASRWKSVFWISLPVIIFLLINQSINYLRFDTWLGMGYRPENELNLNFGAMLTAFLGNLVSPERGLVLFFPLTIFSIFGLAALFKQDRLIGTLLVCTILGSMLMYALWGAWDAGISWGPRFLIPLLPYLAMLVFFADYPRTLKSWKLALFLLLLVLGAFAVFQGLLFTPLTGAGRIALDGSYSYAFDQIPFLPDRLNLLNPDQYDIRWLGSIQEAGGVRLFIFLGSIFWLGVISKTWFDFFSATQEPG